MLADAPARRDAISGGIRSERGRQKKAMNESEFDSI